MCMCVCGTCVALRGQGQPAVTTYVKISFQTHIYIYL